VDNLLAVVPQEKSPLVRTDEEIKEAVHNELAIDHGLTGANIRVVSVEKGIVTLAGTVPSMSTHVRALQTVMRVPGVVGVKSQIEAPDVLGDADTAARVSYR
jgi:osmotically-inducible protein OsmY